MPTSSRKQAKKPPGVIRAESLSVPNHRENPDGSRSSSADYSMGCVIFVVFLMPLWYDEIVKPCFVKIHD